MLSVSECEKSPQSRNVWPGCVQAAICHAISLTRYPSLSHEQSWDGLNYSVQNSMGARGTISFNDGYQCVGVFFDSKSGRNPFRDHSQNFQAATYLRGIGTELHRLAEEEALQYVLQKHQGGAIPVITAAFWTEGERIAGAEPWDSIVEHGAHLVEFQLLARDVGLSRWVESLKMEPWEVDASTFLLDAKLASPHSQIALPKRIVTLLQNAGEGYGECIESLGELNIVVPQ